MKNINLEELSIQELLTLHSTVMQKLKDVNVLRTSNNPVGDYAEWLVSKKLNLAIQPNCNAGYDALAYDGKRIQIKGRKNKPEQIKRVLGFIRELETQPFDELVAIIFKPDYSISIAISIPYTVVCEYARYNEKRNVHRLCITKSLLFDSRVVDIKCKLV